MARTVDPERHAARRAGIVAAAAAVLAERGYAGATIGAICQAAGVGSGTLFHYFPDKRALFHAVWADDDAGIERLLAGLDRSDPVQALLDVVAFRTADVTDPLAPGLVVALIGAVGQDERLAEIVARQDARVRGVVEELVRAAAQSGRADPRLDATVAARWVCALTDALYLQAGDEDVDLTAMRAALPELVLRFLRAAPARPTS